MKLSEAIRLGAMTHRQTGDAHFDSRRRFRFFGPRRLYATCAIGAAAVALGIDHLRHSPEQWASLKALRRFYPFMQNKSICPVCKAHILIESIIDTHLGATPYGVNQKHKNGHGWTREAIADWVETLEPPDSPAPVLVVGEELVNR